MTGVLITGAGGYIGRLLGERLAEGHTVLGLDVRVPPGLPLECRQGDIRDPALGLSLIHIGRCRRSTLCSSRWSPSHPS